MHNLFVSQHRHEPTEPNKPHDVPNKENVPKQPEVYPPGDKPVPPTDPGKQPIS